MTMSQRRLSPKMLQPVPEEKPNAHLRNLSSEQGDENSGLRVKDSDLSVTNTSAQSSVEKQSNKRSELKKEE